jgi:hypothetical protein
MSLMMGDLDQCDLDRIELIQVRTENAGLKKNVSDLEYKVGAHWMENARITEFNDSLMFDNTQLNLKYTRETTALRRGRNWWIATAIAGVASAFIVHFHWKNAGE